eukprot:GFUD01028766.1.p1 GENE.GFUD01028766.1~~GFUD01028766.1.p1  ORF type:complete len:371 (+),score=48.79 GFUD01028766.1:38-1150(+)
MSTHPGPNISFAGCGFNGIYHIGVCACLKNYAPQLYQNKILGTSAGAMAAVALICDLSLADMARHVVGLANTANQNVLGPLNPYFDLHGAFRDIWDRILPDDIAQKVSGRLHISITKLEDRSNLLVSEFYSKSDLLDAILGSSFVPMMSGWHAPKFRGDLVFDGGYSDNLPVLGGKTITVSPFAGDVSICPIDESQIGSVLNLRLPQGSEASAILSKDNLIKLGRAVVPPNTEGLQRLCCQGYQDAMRYLQTLNLIRCDDCSKTTCHSMPMNLSEFVPDKTCDLCEAINEEAQTKTLPLEIIDVFEEAIEEKARQLKGYSGSSILTIITPYMTGRAQLSIATSLIRTSFSLASSFMNLQPQVQSCPFADL